MKSNHPTCCGTWRAFAWLVPVVAIVAAAVALRLALVDIPNFAPVSAAALFAGYLFRSRRVALMVPLLILLVSDRLIGGYDLWLMLVVYSCLSLPVLFRGALRRAIRFGGGAAQAASGVLALLGCTAVCSVIFFVATNFACWVVTPWYPRSWAGLWECYISALPFFRYTLAGDMFFASAAFTAYGVSLRLARGLSERFDHLLQADSGRANFVE